MLSVDEQQVALTYNMNTLQGIDAPVQFCVTLNHSDSIDASKVLRRITYEHPIYTAQTVAAQKRQAEVNGVNRTYFCGAYWGYGFHEDGVTSALRVCEMIDDATGARSSSILRPASPQRHPAPHAMEIAG